jgi:hypothetical protein
MKNISAILSAAEVAGKTQDISGYPNYTYKSGRTVIGIIPTCFGLAKK